MKTSKILTLTVLSVFMLSFSTALSEEKKTRREVKKDMIMANTINMLVEGDYFIFSKKVVKPTYTKDGRILFDELPYSTKGTMYESSQKRGVNLVLQYAIKGTPDSVWYDTTGKYKGDMVCMYTNQGAKRDQIFMIAYTKRQGYIRVYEVDEETGNTYSSAGRKYPVGQIYFMDNYPESLCTNLWWYRRFGTISPYSDGR
ncbi:MAG: hypothetical protein R3Y19_07055 [Rikenellaceae bacterium]